MQCEGLNMEEKLREILQYYSDTYTIGDETVDEIYDDLVANGVEVRGNSFFCPVYSEPLQATLLLAGTKDKADMWMLKKIVKVLRSGNKVITMLNGNSDYILPQLDKFGGKILSRDGDVTYIQFN